jgi:hypothetical protein
MTQRVCRNLAMGGRPEGYGGAYHQAEEHQRIDTDEQSTLGFFDGLRVEIGRARRRRRIVYGALAGDSRVIRQKRR